MYGLSENGWIDMVLFKEWFYHFLCHAGSSQPLLLLLDGHSSYYNIEAITLARENDVIIITLVPHTMYEECHEFIQSHPRKVITKYQFSKIFSKAWLKSMVPTDIIKSVKFIHLILKQYQTVILVHLVRSLKKIAVQLVKQSQLKVM